MLKESFHRKIQYLGFWKRKVIHDHLRVNKNKFLKTDFYYYWRRKNTKNLHFPYIYVLFTVIYLDTT